MLWGGFVWDDRVITDAGLLHELSGLWRVWFSPNDLKVWEGHYWPMVYTSFWLEHKLWGVHPVGYHVVNVLLHFGNTLLLRRLLGRLGVPGAWVIAAVFAVHPVHVESVAWVIERKDLLSTLFYLAACLTWVRGGAAPRWGSGRYLWTLALFVLGLLCKSIVVTLPAALVLGAWWKQGRVSGADVLRVVPFCLVGVGIAVADVSFFSSEGVRHPGLFVAGTGAHCGARRMVLRGQVVVAGRAGGHLSALGRERDESIGLGVRGGGGDGGGGAVVAAASDRPGAAGGGSVFRGDAGAGAGLCRLRLHAVFFCGGSLSIPGEHWGAWGRWWGRRLPGWPMREAGAWGGGGQRASCCLRSWCWGR